MDAYEFVKRLKSIAPNPDTLEEKGLSQNFINLVLKGFHLEKKQADDKITHNEQNVIIQLLQLFETDFIRFNDWGFTSNIEVVNNKKVFCKSSGTFLTINETTKEIEEYDFDEYSLVEYCAVDSNAFLSALLIVLDLISLRLQGLVKSNDAKINKYYLDKSIEVAGGKKYGGFYATLIR